MAATYLRLGIEHILFGFDHLLFVLALVILVRDWRRVAITVTAFTVAHSERSPLAFANFNRTRSLRNDLFGHLDRNQGSSHRCMR